MQFIVFVKDLSRFGRNYILVGQYIDYVFPSFGIRFIAIEDRIDTASKDTSAIDMMPIMNVFNEWHSANTSKKIRAVKYSQADGILSPAVYAERKFGKKVTREGHNFWSPAAVRHILAQQLYVGDLVQQRMKHISYKNKKVVKVPKEEQVIIPNNSDGKYG